MLVCVVGVFYLVYGSQPEAAAYTPQSLVADRTHEPPYYFQRDSRWQGLPYATAKSTVGESGCGLCCAAMAASYLTGQEITPPVLLNLVGNRCIEGGVNHMGRFCDQLETLYGCYYEDVWTLPDAENRLRDGWVLLAGMSGSVYSGGHAYGGHVLFIWGCDDTHVYIRDPADKTLTDPLTWEQFRAISWGPYFYAVKIK